MSRTGEIDSQHSCARIPSDVGSERKREEIPPQNPGIAILDLVNPLKGGMVRYQRKGVIDQIELRCLYSPLDGQNFPFDRGIFLFRGL